MSPPSASPALAPAALVPPLASPGGPPREIPSREGARKDPSLHHAHAAMASMLQQGQAPIPANYLVWYSYHSDAVPGLRPALDAFLGAPQRPRIPQSCMDDLYAQFFTVEREARSLQEMAARLEGAVREAVGLVNDAREDALRYGGSLDKASGRLTSEPQSLSELLRRLVAETREVSARSEAAARNLGETSRKTQELQAELTEARRLATTDPLTGLANRRSLDEALCTALASRAPLALLLLDVDHFKAVNDTHGHPAGDVVLRHLAKSLAESVGEGSVAARFGGEEFAILLRQAALRDVMQIAERIRTRIGHSAIPIGPAGQRISVTASLGIALATPGEAAAHLIERADAALYEAKRTGRNRVCSDPPLPKSEAVWS